MIKELTSDIEGYDLCIIGAGPAGLTVAAELAYSGLKICVLESGGEKKSIFTDSLKEVESKGLPIKPESRERVVGGTSTTWNGLSAPLDEIDFESRAWTPGSPVSRTELLVYWHRANAYHFPLPEDFEEQPAHTWGSWQDLDSKLFIAPRPVYRYSSLVYLFERDALDLVLHATVTQLEAQGERVTAAICKTKQGTTVHVRAKRFVLAAGGIENPRLLLASRIGNVHDQVGRYFMNHPKAFVGIVHLKKPLRTSPYMASIDASRLFYFGLRLRREYQLTHELLNSYVAMEPYVLTRVGRRWVRLWGQIYRRLPYFLAILWQRLRPRVHAVRLMWFADMEPRANNRVTLSTRLDVLGTPLPEVSYSLSERDRKTIQVLFDKVRENLQTNGLGSLKGSVEEVIDAIGVDASHHMGTTRIGNDPMTSVVDVNCRVHAVENLYVAGSSVFWAAGNANPTYTIVALAIRLADHLRVGKDIQEPVAESKNKILIIGGGKRVCEDVVPVIEFLEPLYEIAGIYARREGALWGRKRRYEVRPLADLSAEVAGMTRYVYLAVPPAQVESALHKLVDVRHAELILDTPAPLSRRINYLLKRFKKIHIAEDSAYLPWLPAVQQRVPREIVCDRSVFRYHGVALLKALCGSQNAPAKVSFARRHGKRLNFHVGSTQAIVIHPRDYEHGALFVDGTQPSLPEFSVQEIKLIGGITPHDTIVTKMLPLKRLGLVYILRMIAEGKDPWSLKQGRNDVRVDRILYRYGLYLSLWP